MINRILKIGILVLISITFVFANACADVPYQRPSTDEFIKVTGALTIGEPEQQNPDLPFSPSVQQLRPPMYIPVGSIVYHWANGITEVFGPNGKRIFIARDSEAVEIPSPGPPGHTIPRATQVLEVPNGASIGEEEGLFTKTRQIQLDGKLIGTIIDSWERY
jgi:hypothetical protein